MNDFTGQVPAELAGDAGAGPSGRAPRSGDGRRHPVQAALHLFP